MCGVEQVCLSVCVCLVLCMFACVYVGECGVGQVRLCVCVVSCTSVSLCVCVCVCVCVVCGVGQVRLCVCMVCGMPSSCRSAGQSECVVLGRSVYVCVSYEECRVAVGLLERLSSWCCAGPSVCVIRGMPSSCRSSGQSVRGVGQVRLCVCVCHTRNAE